MMMDLKSKSRPNPDNPRPRAGLYWLTFAAAAIICLTGGCGGGDAAAKQKPVLLPDSILATPSDYYEQIQNAIRQCPRKASSILPVSELVITSIEQGRDFREPIGPDGFLLRLIPLSPENKPVKIPAEITIFLFSGEAAKIDITSDKPVRTWYVPTSRAQTLWRPSILLEGFLLRLDWGERLANGTYLFVVHVRYPHKNHASSICQKLPFEQYYMEPATIF